MANYANLLATIAANIYTNNNNEVTAAMVKAAVDAMVASLGAGYQFIDVAIPSTNPGTPDYKCFYIASTPGTYTNFGGLVLNDGEVAALVYDTAWTKKTVGTFAPRSLACVKKATRLVFCRISIAFSGTSATISITPNLTGGFVYYETGYFSTGAAAKTTSVSFSNGINLLCFNNTLKDVVLYSSVSEITEDDVLLEAIYAYNGTPTYCCWTSPMIPKTGTDIFDDAYTYQRPAEETIKPESSRIFERVGCIGDSYTEGYIYLSGDSPTVAPNYSWPHYIELLTGNKWSNWGVSGSTAKGWMSGAAKLDAVQASGNKCQAYIVGLMINDRNNAGWNLYYTPVGSIGDIGTNNDTYYAWYYKLIQAVVAVNSSAKIFCCTCPAYAVSDAYNQAVRDIVDYCKSDGQNVYLLDLSSEKYRNPRFYQNPTFLADEVNGHYTGLGYQFMAQCMVQVLADVINDNQADFQDVYKIPFDSAS